VRPSTGLGVLALTLFAGIGVHLAPLDPNILHLQFAFRAQAFDAILSQWQPIGVARYRAHLPADFLLLAVYAVFGFRFGRERAPTLTAHPRLALCVTWALPLAAVADATENALHLVLTGGNVPASPVPYLLAGVVASTKWLGIGVFLVCVGHLSRRRAA